MNVVGLSGRLTADPEEPSRTHTGKDVLNVSIAVNHHARDTVFVPVQLWEAAARNVHKYLEKGSLVTVTGELAVYSWQDKETGQARSRLYLNAREIDFPEYWLSRTGAATDAGTEGPARAAMAQGVTATDPF